LDDYLKQTLDFKILELNRGGRKVILSRKAWLEDEYRRAKCLFWDSVEEGQVRKGTVKRLTDFGAFVDIGGCDGLLHVSEMGWGKVAKPSDVVAINDDVEVYVFKVDREKEKVSLSLKKLIPNPWETAAEKYQAGEIYTGKVMRSAPFGAFIQLEPGLEGLAHISQLAGFRVNKVEDVLVEGMEVQVKVLEVDLDKRRISLSVKEAMDLPRLEREEAPVKAKGVKVGAFAGADTDAESADAGADRGVDLGSDNDEGAARADNAALYNETTCGESGADPDTRADAAISADSDSVAASDAVVFDANAYQDGD
jgi:4-hydroxy-3-methylbut-2-enyl diphosphate reductase